MLTNRLDDYNSREARLDYAEDDGCFYYLKRSLVPFVSGLFAQI